MHQCTEQTHDSRFSENYTLCIMVERTFVGIRTVAAIRHWLSHPRIRSRVGPHSTCFSPRHNENCRAMPTYGFQLDAPPALCRNVSQFSSRPATTAIAPHHQSLCIRLSFELFTFHIQIFSLHKTFFIKKLFFL